MWLRRGSHSPNRLFEEIASPSRSEARTLRADTDGVLLWPGEESAARGEHPRKMLAPRKNKHFNLVFVLIGRAAEIRPSVKKYADKMDERSISDPGF